MQYISMRFSSIVCIVVFFASSCFLQAQFKAKIWDTRDGISNNWVSDIAQDNQGYIWLATQYGLNRFDGYTFKSFTHNPENDNSPIANWVKRIAIKSEDELWLGVDYGGLDSYNINKNKFDHRQIIHKGFSVRSMNKMLTTKNGVLYVATESGLFTKAFEGNNPIQLFEKNVKDIQQNSKNEIFFLSNSTLYKYDSKSEEISRVFESQDKKIETIFIDSKDRLFCLFSNEIITLEQSNNSYSIDSSFDIGTSVSLLFGDSPIIEDSQHRIWIGREKGISVIDKSRSKVEFYSYKNLFEKEVTGIQALSLFEDANKNMWIGTNKGIAMISTFKTRFQSRIQTLQNTGFNDIRTLYEVNEGFLVAADEGLFHVNKEKKSKKILSKKIYGIYKSSSGKLYAIGRWIYEIDTTSFQAKMLSDTTFKGGWSIVEDKKDDLWMINDKSLVRYNESTETFESFHINNIPTLNDPPRIDLLIDATDRLWVCTLRSGVYVMDSPHNLKSDEVPVFKNITHSANNPKSLSNRLTTSLLEASDGTIWIGTDAGLNAVDPKTFEVKRYLKKDGLKDEKIMAIIEDDFGDIWGSTVGNGIFKLEQKTKQFIFLGLEDGLISNNFLLSSVYKNRDGILFFGSDNGIQEIDPALFKTFVSPEIDFFFTSAQVPSETGSEKIDVSNTQNQTIVLDHDKNSLTINFTTLNYHLAHKTQYQYKVDNLHTTWQNNANARNITFNSLPPGKYTVNVTATNPDLNFKQKVIRLGLRIDPPWWRTYWAYLGYFLLLTGVFIGIHRMVLNRRLEKAEKLRLQELDTFKTNFFNNIAHELKTPLTLISGMAKNLVNKKREDVHTSANAIAKSSDELNDLVNQILDISKLEVGKLKLNQAHGDIVIFLKYVLSSFESLASAKEIRLHFLTETTSLPMDFDVQKIKYVFTNLISNAIKNTPVKGDVYLQVDVKENYAEFIVRDNGFGISNDDIQFIFDRYYQTKNQSGGTGIGLSFTRELVALMNGSIAVESTLGKGTTFKVMVPIECNVTEEISFENEVALNDYTSNTFKPDFSSSAQELPLIQIIEDNIDICSYLSTILKQDYQLRFSYSGDSGLKSVMEKLPAIIITDLMMPGKDGFEVCKEIKSSHITDHIPVIMLTARSDEKSKLDSIKFGADIYLEKPFDEKELLLHVSKLLEQRALLRKKYGNPTYWENTSDQTHHETDKFVKKLEQLILENIEDSTFGILQICRALNISRSHLHRKLKSLTGLSTSTFIQNIKLQKAQQFLKNSEMNVSEVAYAVGFEDPAYFSRLFSKTFGHSPSETRKSL